MSIQLRRTVPNLQMLDLVPWNSSLAYFAGNFTDAIMSEEGWTDAGKLRRTTTRVGGDYSVWENHMHFMRNMQKHGKGYYAGNEWGNLSCTHSHPRVNTPTGPCYEGKYGVTPAIRLWVIASWMLANEGLSAIHISGIQQYGTWSWWPEYSAEIGRPLAPPEKQQTVVAGASGKQTVWIRQYTKSVAIVNPSPPSDKHINATVRLEAGDYRGLDGRRVSNCRISGCSVEIGASEGLVLLKHG